LAGFRTAGNVAASLYNPVSGATTAGGIADLNALRAAQTARAAEAEAKVALPRLPAPASGGTNLPPSALVGEMGADARVGTPAQMLPRTAENITADSARAGEQLNALKADQEIAAAQEAAAARLKAQPNPTQGINPVGAASLAVNSQPVFQAMANAVGGGGATPASPPVLPDSGIDAENGPQPNYSALPPELKKPDTATKSEGGRDYNDLLLNLGLGLMAGQSPYALQNLGTAGLGALKAEREQKNQAMQDAYLKAKTLEATNASDLEYQAKLARLKAEPFNPAKSYADVYLPGHERAASVAGSTLGAPMTFAEFAKMFPVPITQPADNATIYHR